MTPLVEASIVTSCRSGGYVLQLCSNIIAVPLVCVPKFVHLSAVSLSPSSVGL